MMNRGVHQPPRPPVHARNSAATTYGSAQVTEMRRTWSWLIAIACCLATACGSTVGAANDAVDAVDAADPLADGADVIAPIEAGTLPCELAMPQHCDAFPGNDPCPAWAASLLPASPGAFAVCVDGVCRRGDATMGTAILCGMGAECAPGFTCVVPDRVGSPFTASCIAESTCSDGGR